MNTLAVFRSRSQALSVYRYLQDRKIACITVNTPSNLQLGCGISIVFNETYVPAVRDAVNTLSAQSFVGFFRK